MKNNSLFDTIILSLMAVLLIIGAHQWYVTGKAEGMMMGFLKSYWIFMFLILLMIVRQIRKNKAEQNNSSKK